MSGRTTTFVEVYEVQEGGGRPHEALAFLPIDGPLPQPGDLVLLSRGITGDSEKKAFLLKGAGTPFLVLEREHLYSDPLRAGDPADVELATYSKTWIHVRRLTEDEYFSDPPVSGRG
jgi:hypothetical protein